jgi:hypothetical protein
MEKNVAVRIIATIVQKYSEIFPEMPFPMVPDLLIIDKISDRLRPDRLYMTAPAIRMLNAMFAAFRYSF